jgi:hypothetical protein
VSTTPISLADKTGERRISRFSLTEVPYVHGISDRAGSAHSSRITLRAVLPSTRHDGVGTPN